MLTKLHQKFQKKIKLIITYLHKKIMFPFEKQKLTLPQGSLSGTKKTKYWKL